MTAPRFLMCPPEFFGVEYVINPWMRGNQGAVDHDAAMAQWNALFSLLTDALGAQVDLLPPAPNLPDMVFTANGGLVGGRTCVPSRFRHAERRGEEPHFARWLAQRDWIVQPLPTGLAFEGAGDVLFDAADPSLLWAAHGFRTDERAHALLGRVFDAEVVSLRLVDDRFYHLDTCFCPLPDGHLLWYPLAFDSASRTRVEARVPAPFRRAVADEDGWSFACNAVAVGNAVVLNACSESLASWLRARGFVPYPTPLTEFLKAGGAARCLTLRLNA